MGRGTLHCTCWAVTHAFWFQISIWFYNTTKNYFKCLFILSYTNTLSFHSNFWGIDTGLQREVHAVWCRSQVFGEASTGTCGECSSKANAESLKRTGGRAGSAGEPGDVYTLLRGYWGWVSKGQEGWPYWDLFDFDWGGSVTLLRKSTDVVA